jgi:hypothetical protein
VTGRRGGRCRKLLADLKDRRGYSHLIEEALDRTTQNLSLSRGSSGGETERSPPTYGGLISVSPPEDHHERRTVCRRGGNPRTCVSSYTINT